MTPPTTRPRTAFQGISWCAMPKRKPIEAASATRNSAAFTVPTTLRGSCAVTVMSDGVTTGPQPPPPVASTKPPSAPIGDSQRAVCPFVGIGMSRLPRPKRAKITRPKKSSSPDIQDFAAARLMPVRTTAPTKADTAPGRATRTRILVSTFP
jgi:hypothetical protein